MNSIFAPRQKNLIFHQQKTKSFDGYRRVVTTDDVKVI